ncbi:MAG TPA: cache domain-containing protein, partial [Paenibacillus sp.]|nr:cache domain-containing protein [Paenibacillus sp.]
MNPRLYSLRAWWRRLGVRVKMIMLYVVVVLLPSCLLMYAYYQKSSELMQGEVRESMLQTLRQAELNLSDRLNNVANVASVLTSHPLLYEYLSRYQTPGNRYQQYLDYKELEKLLESLETTPNVYRIRLYVDPNLLYARERVRYYSLEELADTAWYERALSERGGMYWMDTYSFEPDEPERLLILSGVRVLRDPEQFDRVIGVLVVDIREEDLSAVLADIDMDRNERISLVNADGRVISSPDPSRIGHPLLESLGIEGDRLALSGYEHFRQREKPFSLLYQTIEATDWRLVAEVPEIAFSGKSIALNRISMTVAIVATMVIFILIMFLLFASVAEGMNGRIRKLIRVMKQEGLENLDGTIAQTAGAGDISTLEHSIGRMIQTVKALAEDSFQAKLQEREAMLKALQAQINPHFLYNTLEAINWMA